MDGEGSFLVRDWGKECVTDLTRLKRGFNGLGINSGKDLSVIVRKNRAIAKDRGRPFTFMFSQYESYLKR